MAEGSGLSSFVDIIGKMGEQDRAARQEIFTNGKNMRDAIIEGDAMAARIAGNEADFEANLYRRDSNSYLRQELGITGPLKLQSASLEARKKLIDDQYALEAAPFTGQKTVTDSKTQLNDSEKLFLDSQRNRQNAERFSVIQTELDDFMYKNGYGSNGRYDPEVIATMPFETVEALIEKAKKSNLSSPAFNELLIQYDRENILVQERISSTTNFEAITKMPPTLRKEKLTELGLTDKRFASILESYNRRAATAFELNTAETGPIGDSLSAPNSSPIVNTPAVTAVPAEQALPAQQTTTAQTAAEQPASAKTVTPRTGPPIAADETPDSVKRAEPNKPIYSPTTGKVQVKAVLAVDGSISVIDGQGGTIPFDRNVHTIAPGGLYYSPELRKIVEATPAYSTPTDETVKTNGRDAEIAKQMLYADRVEQAMNAARSELGDTVFNGAFNDITKYSAITLAQSVKNDFSKKAAEKQIPSSHSEFKNILKSTNDEYTKNHPVRAFFSIGGQGRVNTALRDEKIKNLVVAIGAKEGRISKSVIERHLANIEVLDGVQYSYINDLISKLNANPELFYRYSSEASGSTK